MTVVLDTHVLHWWSSDPDRISTTAIRSIAGADELAVADITWYELALLAQRGRIATAGPVERWLARLSDQVRSIPLAPRIAAVAAGFAAPFPGDPADRIIYATALEYGWPLITRDERLRSYPGTSVVTIW